MNTSTYIPERSIESQRSLAQENKQVLLIAPTASYRTTSYIQAAQSLKTNIFIASEGKACLAATEIQGIHIDLKHPAAALQTILYEAKKHSFSAIIGTDDTTTELAAQVANALGLEHNPAEAVRLTRRKDLARDRLKAAGIPIPEYQRIDLNQSPYSYALQLAYPVVVKPLALSASRGVIRANDPDQFNHACLRLLHILEDVEDCEERETALVEAYIPGVEVAIEGILTDGKLDVLTIFDKPDPLEGPYFEETYYITPSRLSNSVKENIRQCIQKTCTAYGLRHGPVHGECRINRQGIWVLELAARTIGGLCARLLRFGTGYGIEELVLMQAVRKSITTTSLDGAAGVMMIPTLQAGILRRVEGVLAAQQVLYIDEVSIQVREGYELVPLPEGSSYLGFIFSHAPNPALAEASLRRAYSCLKVIVSPLWKARLAGFNNNNVLP